MTKIIKNTTNTDIELNILGRTISANGQLIVDIEDFNVLATPESLLEMSSYLISGDIVINDGIADVSPETGLSILQGTHTRLTQDLLENGRIKIDVIGTLTDAKIKVSANDATSGYLEDNIAAGSSKVVTSVQNEGANEVLLIDVDPSNILTSALNNDANFIDASGAPVQPADIADFETTTELNARDVANRNRANHTGTQTASTISNFSAAVQTEETDTTLSFNNTTKVLSYVNEAGNTTNVDLTQFLDDTNLARITTGVMNAATNIVTFTRDDLTTFTVDFSSLNDQAYVNAQIAAHETTLDNHDDVSVSGAVVEDLLRFDGTNWIPYDDFKDHINTESGEVNQSTSFEEFMSLSTNVPATANYKISWTYEWSINTTGSDFEAQIQVDDSTVISNHNQEAKDSSGSGISLPNTTGGTTNTGTSQRYTHSGFQIVNLTAGVHTVDLDWSCEQSDNRAAIYRATITIERWS